MARRKNFNSNGNNGGRPPLPRNRRKSMMLCARTDSATYRDCSRAAVRAGVTLTNWIRTRLAEAAMRDLAL